MELDNRSPQNVDDDEPDRGPMYIFGSRLSVLDYGRLMNLVSHYVKTYCIFTPLNSDMILACLKCRSLQNTMHFFVTKLLLYHETILYFDLIHGRTFSNKCNNYLKTESNRNFCFALISSKEN